MSNFPETTVESVLARFGIDKISQIEPWPFPSQSTDLLARFELEGKAFLLKRRIIEQRGERSLFETQYIQKELARLGIPVPALWEAPDGETLLSATDWETDRKVYFEIQEVLPGKPVDLNEDTAFHAGQFLAGFHLAGTKVDTFLGQCLFRC